jgi:hypothetical protein
MTTPITGETWGNEIDSVRDYILRESELPFAELRPKLEAARRELLGALEGVSDEQAAFRPGSGNDEDDWGIAEALRHVASIEAIMTDRIRALGSGLPLNLKQTYPGYHEDIETRNLPELVETLGKSRLGLLAAVAEIEGRERLDTFDAHRRFGELNCRGWLVMHTLHEQDHARQIAKIKRLEGYPAS